MREERLGSIRATKQCGGVCSGGIYLSDLSPLADLESLTTLTLQRTGLDETMLDDIDSQTEFQSLELLDLRYNQIEVLPASIADLPSLQSLWLHGNAPLMGDPRTGLAELEGKLVSYDPETGLYDYRARWYDRVLLVSVYEFF